MALWAPSSAQAKPAELWTACAGAEGDLACDIPRGVAAEHGPPGHIYVGDQVGRRIVEYTPWGDLVRTWGWDVVQSGPGDDTTPPEDQFEICEPANGDVCKAGVPGGGAGQLSATLGLAVDSADGVYAVDFSNRRVQKFDSEGNFVLTFGGDVNKTKVEEAAPEAERNLCTAASGDVCQGGVAGSGDGQFGAWPVGTYLTIDTENTPSAADDTVFVGDVGRIQLFDSEGNYLEDMPDPGSVLAGKRVRFLAVEQEAGNLYLGRVGQEGILRLNPTGTGTCTIATPEPKGLAAGPEGEAYVIDTRGGSTFLELLALRKYDSDCGEVEDADFPFELISEGFSVGTSMLGLAAGSGCLAEGTGAALYLSATSDDFMRAYGTAPEYPIPCEPPPVAAPEIADQWTDSVGPDVATVRASINPLFWTDTSFHVQYATAACVAGGWEAGEEAGCVKARPEAPLGAGAVREPTHTTGVLLGGLAPETAYRFRFVAESEGGGPVAGKGGTEAEAGADAGFITPAEPGAPGADDCPNAPRRTGASASLPDCRAYEMVSPVDKNGSDIVNNPNLNERRSAYFHSSADGRKLTYSAIAAFGDQPSSLGSNQYLALRKSGGWSSHGLNAPQGEQIGASGLVAAQLLNYFVESGGAFTADLCKGWLEDRNAVPLSPEAPAGERALYERDNCGAGADGFSYLPADKANFAGFSAAGTHVVTEESGDEIYDNHEGDKWRVDILPDGSPETGPSVVGGGVVLSGALGRGPRENAVAEDGSVVFWTDLLLDDLGTVYARLNPAAPETPVKDGSGNCVPDPVLACTVTVSGPFARYRGASVDGSMALVMNGFSPTSGNLVRRDVEAMASTAVAGGVAGSAGYSHDLSRIYFASTQVLTGEAPGDANSEGEFPVEGQPNLYLDDEGQVSFVATLAPGDVPDTDSSLAERGYSVLTRAPLYRAARVSPDGGALAFQSAASLTGFDNTDAVNGKADLEVFHYAAGGDLECVSCAPSGARPTGAQMRDPYKEPRVANALTRGETFAAAWIPTWEHPYRGSKALSEGGGRLFFNSYIPLVAADANGEMDVYQWEAPGEGTCKTSSPSFRPANGGCVDLISSGSSPHESEFIDASADGRDVFFTTAESLVGKDDGLIDIYDARAGGGFEPPPEPSPCVGDSCQDVPDPPPFAPPGSAAFAGPGNLGPQPRSCRAPARRAQGLSRRAKRLRRAAKRASRPPQAKRRRAKAKRLARGARKQSNRAKRCRRARKGGRSR